MDVDGRWILCILNLVSIVINTFCSVTLLRLIHDRIRIWYSPELLLHVWITACLLGPCVILAIVDILYDIIISNVMEKESVITCVTLDSLLGGGLLLLSCMVIVQSSVGAVMTLRPLKPISRRSINIICTVMTVVLVAASGGWAWSRKNHLKRCEDIPSPNFTRFNLLILCMEIGLVLAMASMHVLKYVGAFVSRRKALSGRLTVLQFLKFERRGLMTVIILLVFFVVIRLPRFVIRVILLRDGDVDSFHFCLGQVLTRCSCCVLPLTVLISKKFRPHFRSLIQRLLRIVCGCQKNRVGIHVINDARSTLTRTHAVSSTTHRDE